MANLNTYGDLKRLVNTIKAKQRGEKILSKGKEFALDQVLGLIPGASNAKTTYDFLKAGLGKPDTRKTGTWLDKLDVDDEMSAIIDDTVENGFLKALSVAVEQEPDDKALEDDFNMNQKMVDYLKSKYSGRTVTGISEVTLPQQTTEPEAKVDTSVSAIEKDVRDQTSNFKNIRTAERLTQLLDAMVDKLDPKFKESAAFKQGLLTFYKKHKQ